MVTSIFGDTITVKTVRTSKGTHFGGCLSLLCGKGPIGFYIFLNVIAKRGYSISLTFITCHPHNELL